MFRVILTILFLMFTVESSAVNQRLKRFASDIHSFLIPVESENKGCACLAIAFFLMDYTDSQRRCDCLNSLCKKLDRASPHLLCALDVLSIASLYIPSLRSAQVPIFPAHKCYIKDVVCIYSLMIPLYITAKLFHSHPILRELQPLVDSCFSESLIASLIASRMILVVKTLSFIAQHMDHVSPLYYFDDDDNTPTQPDHWAEHPRSIFLRYAYKALLRSRCHNTRTKLFISG